MDFSKPYCEPSTSRGSASKISTSITKPSTSMPSTSTSQKDLESVSYEALYKSLSKIIPVIENNEPLINDANEMHAEIIKKGTINKESLQQLKSQYEKIRIGTIEEEKVIRETLNKIYAIQNQKCQKLKIIKMVQKTTRFLKYLHEEAKRIPVWVPPINSKQLPPLCGATQPDSLYIAKCGDMVAAFLPQNGEKCWILATVLGFENEKYQLEDADVDSANRKLGMKKELVKPLPLMKADPITCPKAFFKPNQFVLALYPQTTCFFKAIVKSTPKTCHAGYEVLFEDDFKNYTIVITLAQRFVLSYP